MDSGIFLFYTLSYNPILLNFTAEIVPALAIRSFFSGLLYSFDIPLSVWIMWRMILETNICVLGMLVTAGV